jgi:hypothetical protein
MVRKSQDRNARLTLCEASVCKMEQRTNDMELNATENSLMVQKEQQQLKDMVRASIQQLVQYIFPIEPVPPIPRLDDMSVSDFPIIFDAVCTQVGSYICIIYYLIIPVQLVPKLEHVCCTPSIAGTLAINDFWFLH